MPRTIVSSSLPSARAPIERFVENVDAVDLAPAGGDDQIAALDSGAVGGAVLLDRSDEHAVALGQTDRSPQPSGHPWRRDRNAKSYPLRGLAAAERVDPLAQRLVGRDRENQAAVDANGVDP